MALLLLVSALILGSFALWMLRSALDPRQIGLMAALQQNWQQGLTTSQLLPIFLSIVVIVGMPLLIWNILNEWATVYTVTADALRVDSLAGTVEYPLGGLHQIQPASEHASDDLLLFNADPVHQPASRLRRWLWQQQHGARQVRLPTELENRSELIRVLEHAMQRS